MDLIITSFPTTTTASVTIDLQARGRLFIVQSSNLTLVGLAIINGWANLTGGALPATTSRLTIVNCTFFNNTAGSSGGAVFVQQAIEIVISNSIFQQNSVVC